MAGRDPIELRDIGDVRVILLARPEAANALDGEMLDQFGRAIRHVRRSGCRALVIGGKGRNFCAGSDLKAATADPDAMDLRTRFHPVMLALADLDRPIVAAVNGAAAGGGLSLALAADMRVMAASARLVPSWLPLGLVPDLGASWHIARYLGAARAIAWLAGGQAMGSDEAERCGLANRVVADGAELDEAIAVATGLADIAGPAFALTRRLLHRASTSGFPAQLEAEATAQAEAMRDPGQIAALAARVRSLSR